MPTRMVSPIASGEPPHSHDEVVRFGNPLPPLASRPWQTAQLSPNSVRPVFAHGRHQARIGLDLREALAASICSVHAARSSAASLTEALTTIAASGRRRAVPSCRSTRAAMPASAPSSRPQNRNVTTRKKIDRPRNGRIQLLDAVPFMAGRQIAGVGIAFFYRHGLSSSSRMRVGSAVELLLVGWPIGVDSTTIADSADQIEQAERLGEPDDGVVVDDPLPQSFAGCSRRSCAPRR